MITVSLKRRVGGGTVTPEGAPIKLPIKGERKEKERLGKGARKIIVHTNLQVMSQEQNKDK